MTDARAASPILVDVDATRSTRLTRSHPHAPPSQITKLEMAHLTHRVNTVEQIQEQLLALFVNPNPQTALSQSGVPSAPHAVVPGLGGPTSNNASENRNTVNDTLQSIYAQMRESRRVAEVAAYTLANEVGVNGTGGAGLLGVAGPNLGGGGHGLLGGLSNIYDVRGAAHLEAMYQQQQQQQQQQHQHQHQHQHHQQANAVAPPDGRAQMAFGQGAEGIGLDRNNTGLF
jgi:hypothetical protein